MNVAGNRARRYALIGVGVVAALVLIVVFFPWSVLRGPLESYASGRLDRPVTIGGLAVDPGWVTRVQLDDVTVGNAAWSATQPMATFPRMAFTFRIPSLFGMSPDTTRLDAPNVLLERNANRDANWHFNGDGSKASVRIGSIDIDRGVIRYRDAMLPASIDLTLQTQPATADKPQTLQFTGRGTFRGEPFAMDGRSEGIAELRDVDAPYHLVLNARAGRTSVQFDGTVVPSDLRNVKGALHLNGPDLSQLHPIVPAPLPWTPPYDLTGDLEHADAKWMFRNIRGRVGDSDLAGEFTVDRSSKRALTTANLTSRKFNYKDLGGFVGLPPGEAARARMTAAQQQAARKREAANRALPDKPFDLARLREHDVDVRFKGTSVKWGTIPLDNLVTHIILKDGVMRFEPLDFGIADGHVISNITLDVNQRVATAQAKIEVRNIELKRIFPDLASPRGSAGRIGGRAQFRARGNSVADLFASADGEAAAAMRGGEASTLQLVLTNLDLAGAAQLLIGGDKTSAIHCAVAALHAKDGVMTPDLLVIDTSTVLITGHGSIDFRTEKYDLHLDADSKKVSIFALRGPIAISGTFKDPTVGPEAGPLAARIGASVGLGILAGPLALLPLIDLGDAPDADCRSLYQNARVKTDTGARIARPAKGSKPAAPDSTAKAAPAKPTSANAKQ